MIYGDSYSTGYGDPKNTVTVSFSRPEGAGYLSFLIEPTPGFGNAYFGLFVNATFMGSTYIKEGNTGTITIPAGSTTGGSYLCVRLGGTTSAANLNWSIIRGYEADTSQRATIEFVWPTEIIGSTDGFMSGWLISGLRYAKCGRVESAKTWGVLTADAIVDGSEMSVTVYSGSTEICSGEGSFPGTITLSGDGGITGSVTVGANAATASSELYVRWPALMRVKRAKTNPPSAIVDTVEFGDSDSGIWTDPEDLDAGTYYYRLQPVSDTGDVGVETATLSATLYAPPAAPTITGASGNATATAISFVPSATEGVTYNVYAKQCDGAFINTHDVVATGTESPITVNAISGYPGKARFIVRAVLAGVEEKNTSYYEVEYAANGSIVAKRPNAPSIDRRSIVFTNGRTMTVKGNYLTLNEAARATHLKLFVCPIGSSFDYTAPVASASLTDTSVDSRFLTATLTYTFPANGLYHVSMKSFVTSTNTYSENPSSEDVLVNASDVDALAPTAEIHVSRG